MKVQKNISLKEYNTFRVGGNARYFVVVKNIEDLKQAVIFSKEKSLPVFVLGGGSNLLISDEGVDGLVIKMEMKGIEFSSSLRDSPESDFSTAQLVELLKNQTRGSRGNPGIIQVTAFAGEIWDDFVKQTVDKGLYGLENLSYIPGTVGASVIQNIGAYGVEVKDIVDWVEVFDIKTSKIKRVTGNSCDFGYRDSIFKKDKGKNWIVVKVAYNLQKNGKLNLDYFVIAREKFVAIQALVREANPCPKSLRKAIIQIRKNKLPNWKKVGTAGSFFKNPSVTKEQLDKLLKKYPELPIYKSGVLNTPLFKIPLAYILDKILGIKGCEEGGVGLYKNQPLVLVNHGNANCEDVKNFAQKIQKDIKQKTGLDIDFEVVEW